jgi:hypothetical protein
MVITLSNDQVEQVRGFVGQINVANFNEECEPPGYDIVISFVGPYGTMGRARCEGNAIELGEIHVSPAQYFWLPTPPSSGDQNER